MRRYHVSHHIGHCIDKSEAVAQMRKDSFGRSRSQCTVKRIARYPHYDRK
jgi:hypothetical protein